MKWGIFIGAALATILASPAYATLSIAFANGASTLQCQDGQACDLSGPTSNLLVLNQQVGAFHVEGSFAASTFGPNSLSDSNLTITNTSGSAATLTFAVGDTSFLSPVARISMSGSGTFENSIGGSGALSFHADAANAQGGVLLGGVPQAPGTLLFNPSTTVTVNPQAFSGNDILASFMSSNPFSMSLDYSLTLPAGGSIVGLESAEVSSAIPEPSTWVLMGSGFAMMGLLAMTRRKTPRYAL
jgi:hypothetical protein